MDEQKFDFSPSGKIIVWTKEQNLSREINSTFSQLEIPFEHYNNVYMFSYSNMESLEYILRSIYKLLTPYNRRYLLCSFYSDDVMRVLSDSFPFVELYHNIINKDIIKLIQDGELYSVIQPIYNIQNNTLFGYEFLLRGKINGKIVPPVLLYETATDLNMQNLLDVRAREISVMKAAKLVNKDLKIFINFLPSTIHSPDSSLNKTFNIANFYSVPYSNLVFEIVETEEVSNIDELKKTFNLYRQSGTMVAMDDVGTGYASLSKLHQLLPDYVKIDRDLVSYCDQNISKYNIIQTIVELCKKLNILVLAEGIERKEELDVVKKLGMDLGQGYLLGRPSEEEVDNNMII